LISLLEGIKIKSLARKKKELSPNVRGKRLQIRHRKSGRGGFRGKSGAETKFLLDGLLSRKGAK